MDAPQGGARLPMVDISLALNIFSWYMGTFQYAVSNYTALKAAGGSAGFPMTVATMQLMIGGICGASLWLIPGVRGIPMITWADVKRLIPVSLCIAGVHARVLFALLADADSFDGIVRITEPVFAAVLATTLYGERISKAKWRCFILFVVGILFLSIEVVEFAWSTLISAGIFSLLAAFKNNETKRLMDEAGIRGRLGSVGNQCAIATILAALLSVPVIIVRGEMIVDFVTLLKTNPELSTEVLTSGFWCYFCNELAMWSISRSSAVTLSVANSAKSTIALIGMSIVLYESVTFLEHLGLCISVVGVLLYSVIDPLLARRREHAHAH